MHAKIHEGGGEVKNRVQYTVKKWIMGLVIFIKKIKVIVKNSEYISLKKLWFSVV